MKSLNDYIWNDEQLDKELNSPDCAVSAGLISGSIRCSDNPLLGSTCNGSDNPPQTVCGDPVSEKACYTPPVNPPQSNCPAIDPMFINVCIEPMGVSCGALGPNSLAVCASMTGPVCT